MNPLVRMLKNKKKHLNIYDFWNTLTRHPFDNCCKIINDQKYLSNKVINLKVLKTIVGDEEIDVDLNDLFDLYLVKCYNNMSPKIQAHYVYIDTEERRYILSDGLTKYNQFSFWQMLYKENIGIVIAIIYNKESEDNDEVLKDLYWKNEKCTYEDIVVICLNKIKVNVLSVSGYKLLLKKEGDESKNLQIYHVYNWKSNEIPHSDLQFVSKYQQIIKDAPKKDILIHSSRGTGSRVYMLTYFLCIYNAMKSNKNIDCPMKVIKGIRERRQGGNLVPYEFAYIIKALVTTFFNNKILINFSQRCTDFITNYYTFFYDYLKRKDQMNLKEFLNFVNIVDLGRIDSKIVPNHCKRFQKAVDNFQNGKDVKKCHYKNVQCFDSPLYDTVDDMLDKILRYKITVVIILVKPDESTVPEKKWIPYFPEHKKGLGILKFTVIHYQRWPDKSISSEHRNIRELYNIIIDLRSDDYIAIHCGAEIGRTGTLALIIYLIDTINYFPTFDPIARLKCL
uniref:Tyrosine phosphatase n=1 Tax=Strongyloides venezuelensis TaxID=75913 RepID=A0A0K0G0C1_STRVS